MQLSKRVAPHFANRRKKASLNVQRHVTTENLVAYARLGNDVEDRSEVSVLPCRVVIALLCETNLIECSPHSLTAPTHECIIISTLLGRGNPLPVAIRTKLFEDDMREVCLRR